MKTTLTNGTYLFEMRKDGYDTLNETVSIVKDFTFRYAMLPIPRNTSKTIPTDDTISWSNEYHDIRKSNRYRKCKFPLPKGQATLALLGLLEEEICALLPQHQQGLRRLPPELRFNSMQLLQP